MRTRTFLGIWAGIFAIAFLLWLGVYAYDNIVISGEPPVYTREDQPGRMTTFLVARPNFIVNAAALGKVEIWAVPASVTEISEDDYQLLGNATLQPGSSAFLQIWSLPIPVEPVAAIEIFAKGFDMKGDFIGQMSLPYLGATQLFNAVWAGSSPAPTSSDPNVQRNFSFVLRVGEREVAGGLGVRLVEIESDSRCPISAVCVWAGEVAARVQLTAGNITETVTLHSMSVPSVFDRYQIGITGVAPARRGTPPSQGEYRITFSVERM